ncbi:HAD family hydrolase [bacterium Scap17]|nr:HAD family hydrolase [bacterium Scap17]
MNKALYVFDFDGVIADSLTLCLKACEHAAHLEGRTIVLERDSWESLDNVTFEEMARVQGFTDEAVARFAAHVFAYTRQATPPAVFTGMREALSALAEQGDVMVLSANHSEMIRATLAAAGLSDCVSQVLGGEIAGSKGAKLARLLAAPHVAVERSWMVGDAVSDIRAAHEAGCRAAAVSWGWQSPERLTSMAPERIIAQPQALMMLSDPSMTPSLTHV